MLYDSVNHLMGFSIVESNAIVKKVQARTHKKKRISKKWLKRYGLKEVPDYETVYIATPYGEKYIFAQPKTIEKIKNSLQKEKELKWLTVKQCIKNDDTEVENGEA